MTWQGPPPPSVRPPAPASAARTPASRMAGFCEHGASPDATRATSVPRGPTPLIFRRFLPPVFSASCTAAIRSTAACTCSHSISTPPSSGLSPSRLNLARALPLIGRIVVRMERYQSQEVALSESPGSNPLAEADGVDLRAIPFRASARGRRRPASTPTPRVGRTPPGMPDCSGPAGRDYPPRHASFPLGGSPALPGSRDRSPVAWPRQPRRGRAGFATYRAWIKPPASGALGAHSDALAGE
jgi:hypothetical protein